MQSLYHLAQVNIAVLREPIDSELLADFVAELDPVNAEADAAPGFVWRLLREHGPTPVAFTFKQRFGPPVSEPVHDDHDDWLCPA